MGQDILVDADVLNQLIDPLLHILRNAVDHGLESPDEREAAGKPRAGTIRLTVARRGQVVTVQVADDGRGLEPRAHPSKRPSSAACSPSMRNPSDAEIARLTLLPGFSTRDAVTEISGRGVGLDVVATRLRSLSGSIDIKSDAGRGLSHRTALPGFTGGHARAVRARRRPGLRPRQSHRAARRTGRRRRTAYAKTACCTPTWTRIVIRAHELSALTGLAPATNTERRNLVIVDTDTGPIGVLVDAVLDANELVTRPTGQYPETHSRRVPASASPATAAWCRCSTWPNSRARRAIRPCGPPPRRAARRNAVRRSRVLVVDDSLSVRRAVATLLEDHGYDVMLARDGLEAAQVHGGHRAPTRCSPTSKCPT